MLSAVSEDRKKRKKALDVLSLLGAALLVAGAGTAGLWVADNYHISPAWLFAAVAGLIFFLTVGWGTDASSETPPLFHFFWPGRSCMWAFICWF